MQSNVLEGSTADVLSAALSATNDELLLVAPDVELVEALIEHLDEDDPSVRLLASERTLKTVMGDFLAASRAADLVESGRLSLRTYEGSANTLVVTDESVAAIVRVDDRIAALTADEESFVEEVHRRFSRRYDESETFTIRTPALSTIRSTLTADLGDATANDFDAVLSSLATARGDGDGLDEVTISLLVAARNEDLLYDISKWGENIGIASKATFSRTKSHLEELGLITTEKVPIDVGRPRLRLKLGDDRLRDTDPGQLASVAQSILAA